MEKKVAAKRTPGLVEYLQAGYPCLFLQTVESEVAEARIREALSDKRFAKIKMSYGVWKVTTGFRRSGLVSDETLEPIQEAEELNDALSFVEKAQKPIAAVFHNIREFLRNPAVVQQLIDAILAARFVGSHIFLVGAFLEVPPELRSLITYVDCPLPTRDQIQGVYQEMIQEYKDQLVIPKGQPLQDLLRSAATAAVGLDSMGVENALSLSLALTGSIDLQVIQAQKEQEVKKSDVLEFIPTEETMENVGGFAEFKEWMRRREKVFTEEARAYGLPYPKGVLIVGTGGTGKSLVAKAIAGYLRLPLLRLDMGKIYRPLVGESEGAIRMALQVVEAVSPVVLWIDELEKGLSGMRGSGELDSGVGSRVVSTLLTWRQETKSAVFVAATANDITTLPSMVYRKGRFDEVWATDLPDDAEREEIFSIHIRKRRRDPSKFDLEQLSRISHNYTGAEIEAVIEDAMFAAFDREEEVTTKHIVTAIRETRAGAERDKEEVDRIRKWCETRARLVSGKEAPSARNIGFVSKTRRIKSIKNTQEEEE